VHDGKLSTLLTSLTNKGGLAKVTSTSQDHLQKLSLFINLVVLFLQGYPCPVKPEMLVLQLVAPYGKIEET